MRETKCTTEKRGKKANLKPCSWMEWLWWLSAGTWQQEQLQWTVPPRRSTESKRKKVTIRTWTETQFNHQRMQNSLGFFFFFLIKTPTMSSHACSLLKMIAAPRLLAGLMPVPVMGMVAKWTKNTANPMGRGAKICIYSRISVRVTQDLYGTCSHLHTISSNGYYPLPTKENFNSDERVG